MKKIIFTVINDLTYDQRMHRICDTLAKAGYEVHLIGRILPNSKPFSSFSFQTQRLRCWSRQGKGFYIEYNIRLFFFLLFQKFDAVCAIDLDTILPAYGVSRLKRKICIYDAHEYFTEVPEVVERPRVQKIWEKVAQWTIPNLTHCYTVCESLAKIFEQRYGTPFEVIRNVPIPSRLHYLDNQMVLQKYGVQKTNRKVLLYQGALNDGRGIEEVITTMLHLDGVELWLAGEGDLSQELRELTQALNLEKRVHFLGYVLPDDLKVLTPQADIGLNLLKNKGLNYYYSLANKCFDYLQAEVPAIHMNFPEYRKINAQFEIGVLVDNLEVMTLKNAVNQLLEDAVLYQKIKENCRAAKEVFVWKVEAQKLIQFYHSIV